MFEDGDTPVIIKPPEKVGFDRTKVVLLLSCIARRIRVVVNIPDEIPSFDPCEILVPSKAVEEVIELIKQQGYNVI
ncbi:hypothetical protein ACFLZH_01775 [Patescibacteria group bacterium]